MPTGNVADAHVLAADKLALNSPDRDTVSGQAFFITDGKPSAHKQYTQVVWKIMGAKIDNPKRIPYFICWIVAYLNEFKWRVFGGLRPALTLYIMRQATTEQWYSCEKVIVFRRI